MIASKPVPSKQYLWIALVIVAACFLLFSIDKDTHHFSDLFQPGNLVALAVYFIPTYVVCIMLFHYFARRHSLAGSTALSLLIGIPVSFALVIILLLLKMHRLG